MKMILGIVIGLFVGCLLGVFVTSLCIGARSADKQLEKNADYLRAYHLKKSKTGHESKYIETEKAASKTWF